MRILFLHEVGYLEKPIFEMHEFPEHLAAMGHDVGFVDYPEEGGARTITRFGWALPGRVLTDVSLKLYSQKTLLPAIAGRLLAVITFPFFFLRVLSDFKPDVVVCYSVPTSGWQAAIICKLQKRPLLFRALDVSHKIRRSLFAPLIKLAEKVVYSSASWVSCNNPAMLEYCYSHGARPARSSVDFPPLDLSHFLNYQSGNDIRALLGIPPRARVVLYMGSFFYFSGLDEVLRQLGSANDKVSLVLIGGGEQDAQLRAMAKELQLEEFVTFTGFVDFGQLPAYLAIADVAINPMVPSLVSNKAFPNKILQYMASGLPVVTTKLEGLLSVFPNQEGVRYVNDSSEVMPAVLAMLENAGLQKIGEANRVAVGEIFNINLAVQVFAQRLIALGSKS